MPDKIKLLLEAGADPNTRDEQGNTPLHLAVKVGWLKRVGLLVSHGADVNVKNNEGESPLSIARANGHKDVIEFLSQQETEGSEEQ